MKLIATCDQLCRVLRPTSRWPSALCLLFFATGVAHPQDPETAAASRKTQHILFVGDSFTHGRYLPVRTYNNTPITGGLGSTTASTHVVDENFDSTDPRRQESQSESGPWGGIPGIFAEFAEEAGLRYDVHIEAISATTLKDNYAAAKAVITKPLWDSVVLQEATYEAIPSALSGNPKSDPEEFFEAVHSIESGVHSGNSKAKIYLYETGAPADTTYACSNPSGEESTFSATAYDKALIAISNAYHNAYLIAAEKDGQISGIAATGDAWELAWAERVAEKDPYLNTKAQDFLTFNYQPGSNPATTPNPESAGFHHPSVYGAYLNALVLLQKITGFDVRALGPAEMAAHELGIKPFVATQLQDVAWRSVAHSNERLRHVDFSACSGE